MSNFIANIDVPNIRVLIRNGDEYNVTITNSDISTAYTGSFSTYADLAGQVVTASYALVAGSLLGLIDSASYSVFAVTASYVSGAASDWNSVANKPAGLVSSSAQAAEWSVATASYAANADLFDGRNSPTFASTGSNTFVGNQTVTGSITMSGSIGSVDYIDFTQYNAPTAVGRLGWDTGNGTLTLGMVGGNTSLQVGEELLTRVYNDSGGPLIDGQLVYITGAQGNRVAVQLASATNEGLSSRTMGMVTEPIAAGQEGYITVHGTVNGLNTIGLTEGAALWLSSSAGQYTQTKPVAPLHTVAIGFVQRVHATVGSIYIKIQNGFELGELHDVLETTTTASYGDLLTKSGSLWVSTKQLTGSYGLTGSLSIQNGTLLGTSSFATSASFAPTILPAGTISSSVQINTGSFSGSFIGTLTGTSSFATTALTASYISGTINFPDGLSVTGSVTATGGFIGTASYALTASYVSGAASSWDTISGKPSGLVSSSAQATTWTVATASLALTASYFDGNVNFPEGLTITGSTLSTGGFTGSLQGTSSWAQNSISASFAPLILPAGVVSSSAQAATWTVATASLALTASYVSGAASTWDTISGKPSGLVSSSVQINTGSFSGSFTGTLIGTSSWATTASFAISSSFAPTILPNGIVSSSSQINTGSFSGSFIGIATTALTASYISGGMVIIGLPTDAVYGGSAGNVSGISSGDRAEDAFDKVETILGKLAPAKPANLSTRTLTTNATVYTAVTASGGSPVSFANVTANANPTASWTFVAATSGSGTTLSFDADAGTLQAEVDGVVSSASQRTMVTSSDVGSYGNLIITSDLDPYNGTFGQQGFWKGFIASVAPTSSLALGPHNSRLLHSTTGNSSLFTWSRDNPSTPSISSVTGSSTGGATRYVSGVPTLATGETVIIRVTGSNAVSQFYNSTRIFAAVGNNSVAPSVNATLPVVPPASASVASASITLTVATNAFTSASTYTATIYNSAGTTATSTWTPTAPIRVDTISNENARARSGIGWYPDISTAVSGAGAIWTASANLTGSRELQMTNNLYHYPSASNYATNYPTPGPNYIGLAAETTGSFPGEAVRWATFSGSVNAASNVSLAFAGTNAAFVGVQTTGSMRLYVRVSGSAATNGWIDGATAYPGTGNPLNNGDPALVVGSSTTTTKVVTFGGAVKTGTVFVRVGIPSSSLAGSARVFSGVTITQV